MKRNLLLLFTILLFSSSGLFSQTVHEVSISNFEFDPDTITIQQGDVVRWTNADGFHSVQGNLVAFPENPEGFGNEPASGNWQYEFTFNTEGVYDYRCGVHQQTMFGQITVEGTVGISEVENGPAFVVFPNPINDYLRWKWNDNNKPEQAFFTLFDAKGTEVKQVNLLNASQIDMNNLSEGLYMYSVDMNEDGVQTGKLLISR